MQEALNHNSMRSPNVKKVFAFMHLIIGAVESTQTAKLFQMSSDKMIIVSKQHEGDECYRKVITGLWRIIQRCFEA